MEEAKVTINVKLRQLVENEVTCAIRMQRLIDDCRARVIELLGPDANAFVDDVIHEVGTLDWMLKKLDVEVIP